MTQEVAATPQSRVSSPSGMAIAALVLGIVGTIFGQIPLTFFIALACGIPGIVFGAVAVRKAKAEGVKATMAKWGLALGIVAVLSGVWGIVTIGQAVNEFGEEMERIDAEFQQEMDQLDNQYAPYTEYETDSYGDY